VVDETDCGRVGGLTRLPPSLPSLPSLPDHRGDGKAYETYGIDKTVGAVIIVRPDQYIGLIVGLEDTDVLDRYFAGLLVPAKDGGFPASEIEVVRPPVSTTTTTTKTGAVEAGTRTTEDITKGETLHRESVQPPNVLAV
jgi:hypothetical protein